MPIKVHSSKKKLLTSDEIILLNVIQVVAIKDVPGRYVRDISSIQVDRLIYIYYRRY